MKYSAGIELNGIFKYHEDYSSNKSCLDYARLYFKNKWINISSMDIKNILKEYEYGETSLIRKNKIFKKETENMLNGLSEILKYKNTHSFYYTKNDNYIIISDNGNRLLTLSKDILTQIFLDNDYFKGLSKTIVNFKIDDYVNFKKEISYLFCKYIDVGVKT